MAPEPVKVVFVCLGNICRSPLAEGVFRHLVRAAGVADAFDVDSAGTSDYHVGDAPDARAAAVARRRGIKLDGRARRIEPNDLERFDYVIAMDVTNLEDVKRLAHAASPGAEIRLLREFDPKAGDELDVPDPYFGGPQGFERVHAIVERSCRGLLDHIRRERGL